MGKSFATPLVIVLGCSHPAPPPPPAPAPVPPAAWVPPPEYVATLPPLGAKPPRAPRRALPRAQPWPVDGIAPDGDGSRVRIRRVNPGIDERWEITFVDGGGHFIRDGACAISGWDEQTVECHSEASPRDLAPAGVLASARVTPAQPEVSPELAGVLVGALPALQSKREVRACADVPPGTSCNPPAPRAPLPHREPPVAMLAKVTALAPIDARYRVRIERPDDGITTQWTATFVDASGHAVPDGACGILDFDHAHVDCETTEWIALITPEVRLEPPGRDSRFTRALKVETTADGVVITFGHGARHGVERGWRVEFVDAHDAPTGATCVIDLVRDTMSSCRIAKRPDSNRVEIKP